MHRIDGPGATADNKFTEGDPVGGVQATVVTDDFLNDVQEELMSVLTAAGVAPVKGTQDQVFKALAKLLQSQKLTAFTTAGTATVLTLAPLPAIDALEANQRFRVKFNLATGANPTLNVSGKGAKNLKQYDSSGAKVAAVVAAGQLSDIEYDGTDWVILEKKASSTGVTQGKLDNSTNLATTAFAQSIGFRFNENIVITAAASLTASAHAGALIIGASASAFPLTLPAASTMQAGTAITFLNYGAGTLSVVPAGADIIQNPFANLASLPITTNSCFKLVSTGSTGWYVIDGTWSATETAQGVAKVATSATAIAGLNDTDMMTALKTKQSMPFTIASGVATLKLPSGYIQQIFDVTESISASDYKFFPVSFPTECVGVFPVLLSTTSGGYGNNFGLVLGDVTKDRFLISAGGSFSAEGRFRAIAIGR
jgi:hypothetical protein